MKLFVIPVLSLIMSGLYYLPWLIEPRAGLGPYILAFIWFLVAWIVVVVHLAMVLHISRTRQATKGRVRKHLAAAAIIGLSYLAVIIGVLNGLVVTV